LAIFRSPLYEQDCARTASRVAAEAMRHCIRHGPIEVDGEPAADPTAASASPPAASSRRRRRAPGG
jgi:hypothetical protein